MHFSLIFLYPQKIYYYDDKKKMDQHYSTLSFLDSYRILVYQKFFYPILRPSQQRDHVRSIYHGNYILELFCFNT